MIIISQYLKIFVLCMAVIIFTRVFSYYWHYQAYYDQLTIAVLLSVFSDMFYWDIYYCNQIQDNKKLLSFIVNVFDNFFTLTYQHSFCVFWWCFFLSVFSPLLLTFCFAFQSRLKRSELYLEICYLLMIYLHFDCR